MASDKGDQKLLLALAKAASSDLVTDDEVERWPLRLLRLNAGIGGGIPAGRIIEIHGPSDAGKSTTALEIVASLLSLAKAKKKKILYMDHEAVLDLAYAEKAVGEPFGVVRRLKDLPAVWAKYTVLYFIPKSMQGDVKITAALLAAKKLLISIHDSLPAMNADSDADEEIDPSDASQPAALARFLGWWFPRWKKRLERASASAIIINHARKQSIGYKGPEAYRPWVVNGGENPKFYSDIRLQLYGKKSDLYPGQGKCVCIKVIKNKTSPERRGEFVYHIDGEGGIDRSAELIDLGLELGILKESDKGNIECPGGLTCSRKSFRVGLDDGTLEDTRRAIIAAMSPAPI